MRKTSRRRKRKRKRRKKDGVARGAHEEEGEGRVVKEGGYKNNEEEVKGTPGVPNIPHTNNLPCYAHFWKNIRCYCHCHFF
jgi:hypothetical protein